MAERSRFESGQYYQVVVSHRFPKAVIRNGSENAGSNPAWGTRVYPGVAQSDRAFALGAKGRKFESCIPDHLLNGALAQLGERLICIQEVVGSIPSGSTIYVTNNGCVDLW